MYIKYFHCFLFRLARTVGGGDLDTHAAHADQGGRCEQSRPAHAVLHRVGTSHRRGVLHADGRGETAASAHCDAHVRSCHLQHTKEPDWFHRIHHTGYDACLGQ